jgi:F-type H+-transporting ATPase subunit b
MVELNLTLLIQMVNFLILMGILYKILYKPILRMLDHRREEIGSMVEEAEQKRLEAEKRLSEIKEMDLKARQEVLIIRDRAKKRALEERERIVQEARQEHKVILEQAKEEAHQEFLRAREEVKREVAALSVRIAERILSRELRLEDHKRLIDEYLKEVRGEG